MSLTETELIAARAFRTAQRAVLQQKNAGEPPDIIVSVFIRHYRHDCAKQGGKSVSLELREHYVLSSDRRFGWIFTEGRCPGCGMTARSGTGRLVDPEQRPGRYAGRER